MPLASVPYLPLSQSLDGRTYSPPPNWREKLTALLLLLSAALNTYFVYLVAHNRGPRNPIFPQAAYSPAQDAIEYHLLTFHSGFGQNIPIWDQPPSDEVDEAWAALYEYAYTKVPKSQAALMTNKTYPILGDEGNYMVAIDVFHQLHCLDEVRKAMYPDRYPHTGEGIGTSHMRHCISSLRQSIMCSADISTIVWQWSERSQAAKERSDVVHTCRNFDKIKQWAKEQWLPEQQDMSIYIPDDLDIPVF